MFCSKICLHIYINTNREIASCQCCRLFKYNFGMTQKPSAGDSNGTIMVISIDCLLMCDKTTPTTYGTNANTYEASKRPSSASNNLFMSSITSMAKKKEHQHPTQQQSHQMSHEEMGTNRSHITHTMTDQLTPLVKYPLCGNPVSSAGRA